MAGPLTGGPQYDPDAFSIVHDQYTFDHPPDFAEAVGIAVRVTARTYRVEVTESEGYVTINRPYRVTMPGGHFREVQTMILQGKAKYPVREVMLHCAAIKTGQFNGLKPIAVWSTINRWHIQRGFKNGFGYHGLFMPDGLYLKGRPFDMIGAGCIGKNQV